MEFTPAARRALRRLPDRVVPAVLEFIVHELPENPHRRSKPLRWELEGLRSANRGNYRVLLELNEERRLISIVRIQHRSDVYRVTG